MHAGLKVICDKKEYWNRYCAIVVPGCDWITAVYWQGIKSTKESDPSSTAIKRLLGHTSCSTSQEVWDQATFPCVSILFSKTRLRALTWQSRRHGKEWTWNLLDIPTLVVDHASFKMFRGHWYFCARPMTDILVEEGEEGGAIIFVCKTCPSPNEPMNRDIANVFWSTAVMICVTPPSWSVSRVGVQAFFATWPCPWSACSTPKVMGNWYSPWTTQTPG